MYKRKIIESAKQVVKDAVSLVSELDTQEATETFLKMNDIARQMKESYCLKDLKDDLERIKSLKGRLEVSSNV